jgi:bifunctional DNA-binding transcriptional regulator/antitoxin component of YhaV-PrlF toxin-antitoxin module
MKTMATATMFSRGRLTLPREVRKGLGVGPGDFVVFKTIGNDVYISAAKRRRKQKKSSK